MALFTVAACSAAAAPERTPIAPPIALPAPDAAPTHPIAPRGGACGAVGRDAECADGLTCLAMPGGYCGSPCDDAACDGACTETRTGSVCLQPCASDADCRAGDGYRCDAQWHACAIPNSTAIVPRQCPHAGPERDAAFGDSEAIGIGVDPAAAGVAVLYQSATGIRTPRDAVATGASPRLAIGRGSTFAVWRDAEAIELAVSSDGATWAKPTAFREPADAPGSPLVVAGVDASAGGDAKRRDVLYVLAGARGLGMRVRASHDNGVTFGAPVAAMTGTYGSAVAGADGRLHVVALDGDALGGWGSAMHAIQYAVSSDGGATFGKAVVASGRDELLPYYFASPSIAVDTRRKLVYVAYVRGGRDGVWDVVVAASKDGKPFTRTTIGDGCALHALPAVAVDPTTGTVHVTFYDTAGGARFVHASCASGAATCTVWGAINARPFEPLSTMPRGAKWLGDYTALLVDDKQRTLTALWAQPVREDGRAVTRVFRATAKLRR